MIDMLSGLRCRIFCNFQTIFKQLRYDFEKLITKMNINEISKNLNTEKCKKPHEDDSTQPNKKLCSMNNGIQVQKEKSSKRRKVALLLGYCGKNYYGMQKNSTFRTVESELLQAMHNAGLLNKKEIEELYLIKFQRAARTDKGVSAAQQVVSLFLDGYKVENINAYLPLDIRVFSIKRTTKSFDSKVYCFARTYSYTLPTFALSEEPLTDYLVKDYKISAELIKKIDEKLSSFIGSHNFHNFTSKKSPNDPSAMRYIMSFKCEEPFMFGKEFITLKVKGQSFMLHQIRKMVGAIIAIARGLAPSDLIETAWKSEKISLPLAPGLGLMLEEIHYDKYDRKFGSDGIHDKLTWDDVKEEVENFRKEKILKTILEDEINNNSMIKWLEEGLQIHRFYNNEKELQKDTQSVSGDCDTLQNKEIKEGEQQD